MKALVLDKPGPPDTLRITEIEEPEPALGEVRVRVQAVGLNPVDYKMAQSGHPAWQYPFVLGLDVAGTIDAIGPEVTGWQIGNHIFYHGDLSRPGGFAEYAVIRAHVIAAIPEGVSFVEAGALPCAGFTAYQALFRKLHLQPGQTILVQGGAGGVGGFAVQLAAHAGAIVISTASAHNASYVKSLGAQHVIDYRQEAVTDRVLALTAKRGVDAIVDTVSRASATAGLDMLAFGGSIACIAGLLDCSKIRPFEKGLSIHEIALGGAHLSGDRVAQEDLARMGAELIALVQTKKINAMANDVISLEGIPGGLNRLSGRHVRGKIVAAL